MSESTEPVKPEHIDGIPVLTYEHLDVKNPKPGLYSDVPIDIYHDSIQALSSSQIRAACVSLLNYKRYKSKKEAFKTNEALEFGKAFAMLCEVPDAIGSIIFEAPTKTYGVAWQKKIDEHPDHIFVKQGGIKMLEAMSEAYRNHPITKRYVDAQYKELTVIWKCPHTGEMCKCRPDKYSYGDLLDDKTLRPDHFNERKIKYTIKDHKLRYDVQSTFYYDGMTALGVKVQKAYIAFVQKEEFYPDVAVYSLNDEEMNEARQHYIEAIRGIRKAEETGIYTGIAPEFIFEVFGFDEPETTFE